MSGAAPISRRLLASFAAVLALVVAILGWWTAFNILAARAQRDEALARSQAQRAVAAEMVALAGGGVAVENEARARALLARHFPTLVWDAGAGRPELRPEAVAQAEATFARRVRMFASEGTFFLTMVLLGGVVILLAMRHEVTLGRQQGNFLAAVTHELKSPLASLRLYVETMEMRDSGPADRARYLATMRGDVARLEGLVANLLAAARLEGDGGGWHASRCDLGEEVVRVVAEVAPDFDARGATLALAPPTSPLPVRMDVGALHLVLRNLLDNAAKYGRGPQPVRVDVGRDGRAAVCRIRDAGIGIAAVELGRIFAKFYRVGDEMVRQSPGSGLGLYLARALTAQGGGALTAASAGVGSGACFTLRLPLCAEGAGG